MSPRQHTHACVTTGVDGAPSPMPESLLLRRLSFTLCSAVETLTKFILACESHIPSSPPSPRPSRKRSLPKPPGSPTSVTCHPRSPISPMDVEHADEQPQVEERPSSRRSRVTRSHTPSSSSNPSGRRRPKGSSKTDKLPRHTSRLLRRNTHPKNSDARSQPRQQPRQRHEKRMRTAVRRTEDTRQSPNQRLAFVQPSTDKLHGVNVWRRHRDTARRISTPRSQKRIQPEPPVAPISLPPAIRQVPRGTLTSFLTSDDTTVSVELTKRPDSATSKEKLLEQDIRPSRRVRFAQNVQLVC